MVLPYLKGLSTHIMLSCVSVSRFYHQRFYIICRYIIGCICFTGYLLELLMKLFVDWGSSSRS